VADLEAAAEDSDRTSEDEDDESPPTTLPLYQQRESILS
jgi:hypothetical protein